jgi:predicted DNA-binding transcriptional regulator AlpA
MNEKSHSPANGTPQPASGDALTRPAATLSHPMGEGQAVEPYINKREVARRLNRTVRCIDNMMRRGLLPYYKLGYRVAFRWSEIQQHLSETCRVLKS